MAPSRAMSQAGPRGPGSPQKPAAPAPAKPATPPAPPVAPKGVVPSKVAAPAAPARAGKTTMLGLQAPKVPAPVVPSAPSAPAHASMQGTDDPWDGEQTRVDDRGALARFADLAAAEVAPRPPAPAPSPAAPVVAATPHGGPRPLPAAGPAALPAAEPAALTAADVRLIVRTIVEEALLPLQRAIVDSQHRIAELDRRSVAATQKLLVEATPGPSAVAHASHAVAAPVRTVAFPIAMVPQAPLLDLKAIERDIPIDFDNPFDGRRRRRRMGALLIVALLAIFGGLFALLAESYTPHR
jgi:hypothetical protein